MSAEEVAAFYRDPENLPRIRYSMILFNWFAVGLIPLLALIVLQIRRMAHRTPIFSYSIIACAAGGPTIFLLANLFWLLAAFRPERDPELTLLLNDFAWVTFASQVGFLIAQSVILALAIYLDRQARPVLEVWVGHFNLLIAALLLPASFVGLAMGGVLAWDGLLTFWVRNVAIGLWDGASRLRLAERDRCRNLGVGSAVRRSYLGQSRTRDLRTRARSVRPHV